MRYDFDTETQKISHILRHSCALLGMVMALFFLVGCKDSRVDDVQSQLNRLQQVLDSQSQTIKSLSNAQQKVDAKLSEFSDIKFVITDVQFEIVEKAFEPLIVGRAKLAIDGEHKPELIFVEWSLVLVDGSNSLEPLSFIQRVEHGSAAIQFTQSLPRHNIKKDKLSLNIVPTGWYLGHVAQLIKQ